MAILVAVGAVAAKVPYFSMEVSTSEPRDGDVIVVVVRLWDDARHNVPATWWREPTIEGLIEARGPAGRVPVVLGRLDDATYTAKVSLSAGTWRLIPFPRSGGGAIVDAGAGYPSPMTLVVGTDTSGTTLAAGGALGFVIVALLVGGRMRRRLRRESP